MKIAIIGAGFVGTCLIELLKQTPQYKLLNIDKNPSKNILKLPKLEM